MRSSYPSLLRRIWDTREYRTCLLLMVLMSLATSSGVPLISLFLVRGLHASLSTAGLFYTCQALPGLLLGIMIGRHSDRWPTRLPFLRAAVLWTGAGWLALALSSSPWLALTAGAIFLSLSGAIMGQVFSTLADAMTRDADPDRELITTIVRTGWSFGFVFGPLLGSALAAQAGFRATFLVAACLYLVCLAPLYGMRVATPVATRRVDAGKRVGGANAVLITFTALCALVVCGQTIKNTYLPIDVTVHLGGSMSTYGTIVAVSPIVELVVMPLSGVLAREVGLGLLIAAGILLAVVEYLVLTASTMIWQFYVTQAMDACVVAVIMGLGVTYAQRLSPGRPGAANGIFFSCFNVAFVLGGLIGSASVPLLGVPHIFLIPTVLCTLAWLGFLLIDRRGPGDARAL
jgi:SET family sugar efflux transporter-like MFS transporter